MQSPQNRKAQSRVETRNYDNFDDEVNIENANNADLI